MYINTAPRFIGTLREDLYSEHRHLKTVGNRELSHTEYEFVRQQLKMAKEEDLVIGKTLAGYKIDMVNTRQTYGKIEITIYLNVGDQDEETN